jgi:hypothetical protein
MSRKSSSLKSFELAYKVLSEYVKDECNIQSTPAIKKCIETLKAAKTWYEAFQAPIVTFQFDYSTALHWLNFIYIASKSEKQVEEGFSSGAKFSCVTGLDYINEFFDIESQELTDIAEGIEDLSDSEYSDADTDK